MRQLDSSHRGIDRLKTVANKGRSQPSLSRVLEIETVNTDRWFIRILCLSTLIFFVALIFQIAKDRYAAPDIGIAISDWHAYFPSVDTDADCFLNSDATICPANVKSAKLLSSQLNRSQQEYREKAKQAVGKSFWLGTRIDKRKLKKAAKVGAQSLVLGTFFGEYEVWMDGALATQGKYSEQDLPISLTLTQSRLLQDRDLFVAIQITHNEGMLTADDPNFSLPRGFYKSSTADRALRYQLFLGYTRHLIAFSLFFMLGLIFFSTAFFQAHGYEYFAAGQLAFVLALIAAFSVDSAVRVVGMYPFYTIFSFLVLLETVLIVKLGLGIARIPRNRAYWLWPLAGMPFIALVIISPMDLGQGTYLSAYLAYVTPAALLFAGSICLSQFIQHLRGNCYLTQQRIESLVISAFLFIVTGALFFRESLSTPLLEIHWSRFLMIFHLGYWATFLARDYRQSVLLTETFPVSKYHRAGSLPQKIEGYLLSIDLKSSEKWFRRGTELNKGGSFVHLVISHIWQEMQRTGGIVIQSEGDSLLVWFESKSFQLKDAMDAIFTLDETLLSLTTRLSDSFPELADLDSFQFRGALVEGAVRPAWREIGKQKVPAWIEAGSTNTFVDIARILEFERQLPSQHSQLVLPEELAIKVRAAIPDLGPRWRAEAIDLTSKSGHAYTVSILSLRDTPAPAPRIHRVS